MRKREKEYSRLKMKLGQVHASILVQCNGSSSVEVTTQCHGCGQGWLMERMS